MSAITLEKSELPAPIRSILRGMRQRVRLFICLEGLLAAIIWLGLTFWAALALDYFPVLLGATEMPRLARGLVLTAIAGVLGWIVYRWILVRLAVPLSDASLALLLERKYGDFRDSLITSVELTSPGHPEPFSPEMLAVTERQATDRVGAVRYGELLRYGRLGGMAVACVALGLSFAALNAVDRQYGGNILGQAFNRLYLLNNEPWPRHARVEVLGLEIEHAPLTPGGAAQLEFLTFDQNRRIKVAQGASASLKVKADPEARVLPRTCNVYYHSQPAGESAGEWGSVRLSKYRDTEEGRIFGSEGRPFRGLLSTLTFDVVGYDYRVRDYRIDVVEAPAIVETKLDLQFPVYLGRAGSSPGEPLRDQPYVAAGTFVPAGTEVTLHFRANKPVESAQVRPADQPTAPPVELPVESDGLQFRYLVPPLMENAALEVLITDADHVRMERPQRIYLTAVADEAPRVTARLTGIGSAVTPDVVIPLSGQATDDYGLEKAWGEVIIGKDSDPREFPLEIAQGGGVETRLDFRELRREDPDYALAPKSKLRLAIKATDKHNLAGGPHLSAAALDDLEVVTAEELLVRLEIQEVGLRRRFEQILEEMRQMRDAVLRVRKSLSGEATTAVEPGEDAGSKLTPEQEAARERELRVLRVQRALVQSQKSAAETLGVAGGFLDIREQLINNRIDTEDRKEQLEEVIAGPLQAIGREDFPALDEKLKDLEGQLEAGTASEASEAAVASVNETIAKMEAVLEQMRDLQNYNDLLDIVRKLLKENEALLERTKKEQKRRLLEDLQ
jgi:hypothetical protein